MKKIFIVAVLAAVTCFAAGKKKDAYDIKPGAAKATDAPAAEKWQAQNKAKLADATKDEVLAAFVKDAASASALLAEVKPGFQTCPVKAFQIAAVTQYVMLPGKAGRKTQAAKVVEIGKASGKKCVQEFAEQVATELSGDAMSKMLGK